MEELKKKLTPKQYSYLLALAGLPQNILRQRLDALDLLLRKEKHWRDKFKSFRDSETLERTISLSEQEISESEKKILLIKLLLK